MEKNKAIPQGYMTVGEVAKKMGITVRTLQYYHKEGVLSPSSVSKGGRRLYTDKDVIKLYQLLSMKSLGFSLDDIKNRLTDLDTPDEVLSVLTEQSCAIREQIESLSESLKKIEKLKAEVVQMQSVDFKKYADIITNLQMKNELYWLIKHFDDDTLAYFRSRFDKDSGTAMMKAFTHLSEEALRLQKEGISPESKEGREFAEAYWNMIMEFTNGDMSMLPKLMEIEKIDTTDDKWKQTQEVLNTFVSSALEAYFDDIGLDPFKEDLK
ncbi:MAG: MerR family transcriptional regulator [Eubacteriales bacterium]|nr:MerR family transcriptional regulator [Eubacteriales bacterium]